MSRSARSLARLFGLYQGVETMRLLELQIAAQRLAEARGARELELAAARLAGSGQRQALETGVADARLLAEAVARLAVGRAARLRSICGDREERLAEALDAHAGSRLDADGVGRVLERTRTAAARELDRRLQAAADDRFGARRAWFERSGQHRAEQAAEESRAATKTIPIETTSTGTETMSTGTETMSTETM